MSDTKCFVNENCIGCGVCVSLADQLFAMDGGHSKVIKQPEGDQENALFNSAQSACPVMAIVREAKVIEMDTPLDEDVKLAA